MLPPDNRPPSQRLAHWLPPVYQHLCQLPEEICSLLLPLAVANTGGGYPQIEASYKLRRLAAMPQAEIMAAYEVLRLTQGAVAA